jgi:hypothetical protein
MGKITQRRPRPHNRHTPAIANVPAETYIRLIGMPVCAVLKDGSVYCGTIAGVQNDQIVLQGFQSHLRVSRNPDQSKAQIAALGGLGSLLGGGAGGGAAAAAPGAAGGLGGLGGLGGVGSMLGGLFGGGGTGGGFNLGGMGNWFRIGMGVMQFVFPLMKGFGI